MAELAAKAIAFVLETLFWMFLPPWSNKLDKKFFLTLYVMLAIVAVAAGIMLAFGK
jgi:hypothetical protein